MKVLVVLCAVVASCLAKPSIGYGYSAFSPLTGYGSFVAPYTYGYSAPIPSVYAAPVAPVVPVAPAAVKTQYHSQDELGQAKYGHSEPLQAHDAVQDAHGNKVGSYSYVDPHGALHRTDYVADSLGYRVAANDLPVGPAGPDPVVPADTPEVVAAKAHHFAAHEAAAHGIHLRRRRSAYYGPYALPVVTPSGHLADTPEVAAAKAAHFAEHAKQSGHVIPQPYAAPYSYYAGPYATPVVTPSGHLADTPEVAAAKAAHFAEHAKASGYVPAAHGATAYSSWAPAPVVTPSGHLADTPEVAAAKAAHFAEHAKASGHAYAPAAAYEHYAGAYATPVVTPSGYLADTPEVAAAKAAHLQEHAFRGKRSVFYQTPAGTSPLAPAHIVPQVAVPYATPAALPYAAPVHPIPAVQTEIVHNPGHAFSYRVDALGPHYL